MSRASSTDPYRADDLMIRQKVIDMIEYGHTAVRQFPKAERHVLGAEIRHAMWQLLRLVVVCNKRYHKKTTMQDLDAELDLLRCQIRVATSLGYLEFRRYEHWSKLNDEIGRMIGGWMKSLDKSTGGAR